MKVFKINDSNVIGGILTDALNKAVSVRECVENDFCNGGKCCLFVKGE